MSFTLRAMQAHDLDRVLLLAANSTEAPHWTRREYERLLLTAPEDPLLRNFTLRFSTVALSDAGLVGFAVASWLPQDPAAEVEGLLVEQDHRRQGIGSALVGACMAWAALAGASAMRLEVRESNIAALALYRRHGFSPVGVRRAYYSAPVEDAVLLQAPLLPRCSLPAGGA